MADESPEAGALGTWSVEAPSDLIDALKVMRTQFQSDAEFATYLLNAASFYSEDALVQVIEDLEKRVSELERKNGGKEIRTLSGRIIR